LAVLFAGLFIAVGVQYTASNASTGVVIKGRVSGSDGAGLANVRLNLCQPGNTVVTNASGYWRTELTSGANFCVRYMNGLPAGYSALKAVNNRVAGEAAYEHQVAGYDCAGKRLDPQCPPAERSWDRLEDNGYDFVATAPTASVVPVSRVLAAAVDKTAPAAPGSFQATVQSGSAVVNLSWEAVADAGGLKGYTLERSLDQKTWEKLADSIQATSYSDKSAGFGINYYYRLSAVDAAGNVSGYATSDATTGDFNGSSGDTEEGTTYTSDDNLVTVTMPAGAVTEDVICTVTLANVKDKKEIDTKDVPLVAGPYDLVCKTAGATIVTDFLKPVAWSYDLNDKLGGVSGPKPYVYSNGKGDLIPGSVYSAQTGLLKFSALSSNSTMVLATKNHGLSFNFIVPFLLVSGVIVGVAMMILRKKQKSKYDEYLRSKYYNL
jgi:hypothetical protein